MNPSMFGLISIVYQLIAFLHFFFSTAAGFHNDQEGALKNGVYFVGWAVMAVLMKLCELVVSRQATATVQVTLPPAPTTNEATPPQ